MGLFRASDSLDISLRILTEGIPKGDLVVDSISSSIRGSLRRINKIWEEFPAELADEAYRKASDDQELVENLLGISFVMCQVGITHVVSTYRFVQNSWMFHKESKHKLSKPLIDFLGISTKNIS